MTLPNHFSIYETTPVHYISDFNNVFDNLAWVRVGIDDTSLQFTGDSLDMWDITRVWAPSWCGNLTHHGYHGNWEYNKIYGIEFPLRYCRTSRPAVATLNLISLGIPDCTITGT